VDAGTLDLLWKLHPRYRGSPQTARSRGAFEVLATVLPLG
jgi:hypothetical protein